MRVLLNIMFQIKSKNIGFGFNNNFNSGQKAFTFIDVLVGTFLVLIVFFGIFGAFQLGLKVVGQSKNRIVATAIASGEIEKIRNLPYSSIGTQGGYPSGNLAPTSEITRNGLLYTIEIRVDYIADPIDGIAAPDDDCPNDYKKVEVKVSWTGRFAGDVKIYTDISPKNLAQECSTTGGILSINVFDAFGVMVPSPLIEIKNPSTEEVIKTATPIEGKHYFSLPAGSYKTVISKNGYSTERSYGISEVTSPEKPHPIVIDGQLTEASFSIDKVSSFIVQTLSPWGEDSFSDSFSDSGKISSLSDVELLSGAVFLAKIGELYQSQGNLISIAISPSNLVDWEEFSFFDNEPTDTQVIYKILYLSGEDWILVPDNDLPNNSVGFSISPVDISGLNKITYPGIKIQGFLSTNDQDFSPSIESWQVSWKSSVSTPIPNAAFILEGEKIIGHDSQEDPVLKYSVNHVSDSGGNKNITNLEWDNYTFSINPATGLDLVNINPSSQPISLVPDSNIAVKLYLDSENSLFVAVKNSETLLPVFSAAVRLYNTGLSYDVTEYTNENGQAYFLPLSSATYNIEVQAQGYTSQNTTAQVSGDHTKTINLEQVE